MPRRLASSLPKSKGRILVEQLNEKIGEAVMPALVAVSDWMEKTEDDNQKFLAEMRTLREQRKARKNGNNL